MFPSIFRRLVLGFGIAVCLSGCITSKPNRSLLEETQEGQKGRTFQEARQLLARLSTKNALLASELGKLPEFQDGIHPREVDALWDLIDLYDAHSDAFDHAFEVMYGIGKPEVRKYCAALQAAYWLAEDGKRRKLIALLERDEKAPKAWLGALLVEAWTIEPSVRRTRERWLRLSDVSDRVHAPELLHVYVSRFYRYRFDHEGQRCQTPTQTFERKTGCCVCLAFLGQFFLEKAGYKTFIRHIVGDQDQHGVLVLKTARGYVVAVDWTGWRGGRNVVSGPFETMEGVDDQIKRTTGTKVRRVRYFHY